MGSDPAPERGIGKCHQKRSSEKLVRNRSENLTKTCALRIAGTIGGGRLAEFGEG